MGLLVNIIMRKHLFSINYLCKCNIIINYKKVGEVLCPNMTRKIELKE
jgi:hypothetical protein